MLAETRRTIEDIAFVDDWTKADYDALLVDLRGILREGGRVAGTFTAQALKGFAALKAAPLGVNGQYRDLQYLHVSRDCRGQGIGRALFDRVKRWARENGAEKLYLSAHSAVESQAFTGPWAV